MAKMKKRQSAFIGTPGAAIAAPKQVSDTSEMVDEGQGQSANFVQSCASCQEPFELERFFERPIAQLCYLSSSKLYYYTCRQTVESQKQSLKALKEAQNFTEQDISAFENFEEEKKGSEESKSGFN